MHFKGIDVSNYQGEIDWNAVAQSGITFAIIRAGYGKEFYQKDAYFDQNVVQAHKVGIHTGAYLYSYATSVEEAKQEAEVMLQWISDCYLDYPIVFDIEDDSQKQLSKTLLTNICIAFCKKIEAAGYFAMIYSYKDWFESIMNSSDLSEYAHWVAQFGNNLTYNGEAGIWQFSDVGIINGIVGPVDLDISYFDYNEIIIKNGLNGIQQLTTIDYEEPIETLAGSELLTLGDTVLVNGTGNSASDGYGCNTKEFNNQVMKIIAINSNKYGYACSQNLEVDINDLNQTTGWFKKIHLQK